MFEFIDFTYRYRVQKKPTIHDISLTVMPGEKILIAGPSGSGKSTLGSCINGLIPFSSPGGEMQGTVLVSGKVPEGIFELSATVGSVLQDTDAQFVGLSAGEDIAFSLENKACALPEMKERVLEVAKLVGAEGYLGHSPQRLSGGQKQRISMAGVLIEKTSILLLDEPLAALDPATGKLAIALIDGIAAETGCAVVIIEHRLEDVLYKHIDRVILLNNGRIIENCPPDEIVISPKLTETGIRKPLYVSALEEAGVRVTSDMAPGRIDTLRLAEDSKKKVREWVDAQGQDAQYCCRKRGMDAERPSLEPWTIAQHPGRQHIEHPVSESPLLEAKNIGFTYLEGNIEALRDVSFTLHPGEMTAIVGANGAGKSTLAKLICGFEQPGSGQLVYNGADMKDLTIPERAERIGYVMQNPNQMICKPMIYDEVSLGLQMRGFSEQEIKERVEKVLEVCGLTRFIKWPVSALSYGQKKRVTIADALVLEPQIIILDEPTAGQDWRHYTDIMQFLVQLNKTGVTVLMITHDMHLCLEYAKRALVFADGMLLADLPAYEVLSDPVLAARASLRETSLYELAQICGIPDARDLVKAYLGR